MNRLASALALLCFAAGACPVAAAQAADSVAAPSVVAAPAVADTTNGASRALRRSLILPGWGQVTNGQPAKAPFVAAALAGAAGVLVYQQRLYTLYQRSALFAGCRESPDRDVCADVSGAADEWEATGSPTFAQAAAVRNQTRGRRDLSGLAVAVVYALQALDAYVAAQLIGFDVGEDAAVQAVPGGLALRVRL